MHADPAAALAAVDALRARIAEASTRLASYGLRTPVVPAAIVRTGVSALACCKRSNAPRHRAQPRFR